MAPSKRKGKGKSKGKGKRRKTEGKFSQSESSSRSPRSGSGESSAQGSTKSGEASASGEKKEKLLPFWDASLKWLYDLCPFPIAGDTTSAGEAPSSSARAPPKPSSSSNRGKGKRAKASKKKGKQSKTDDVIKNTWFSSTRSMLKSIVERPWRQYLKLPDDAVVSVETMAADEAKKRLEKAKLKTSKQEEEPMVTRTRKIRMRLTPKQKQMICNWMGAGRYTYNKCLEAVRNENFPFTQTLLMDRFVHQTENASKYDRMVVDLAEIEIAPRPWTEEQASKAEKIFKHLAARAFRLKVREEKGYEVGDFVNEHDWLKETPSAIRQNAVRDLLKAYDSNMAKKKKMEARGKRFRFKLQYRSRRDPSSWTIAVEKRYIKSVETVARPKTRKKDDNRHDPHRRNWTKVILFPAFTKGTPPLLLTEEIPGGVIDGAVKITRNRLGHFHMHVPISTPWKNLPKLKDESKRVVALDPGVRTFQTAYCPDGYVGEYASGERGFARLYGLGLRVDGIDTRLRGNNLNPREKRDLKKKKYRCLERVRNLVNELHKKVANDLCKNFDTILLPDFKSQDMVKKLRNNGRRRVIRAKTARCLLLLKHYAFRMYLASKVVMCGKELAIVTEEYTTQCCGCCGRLKKNLGGSKVYNCQECGFRCGRDENAARNILLKYLCAGQEAKPSGDSQAC